MWATGPPRPSNWGGEAKAVLLESSYGARPPLNSNQSQGGLIVPGIQMGSGSADLTGTTLTVRYGGPSDDWRSNIKGLTYIYIALLERS